MLIKLRGEIDSYQIGFLDRLPGVETIQTAGVVIQRAQLDDWITAVGVTVGTPTIIESGKTLQFSLSKATTVSDQVPGRYRLRCTIVTSANRELVNDVDLEVFA